MYKSIISGKKAASFDLDGTLVDTKPLWSDAIQELCFSQTLLWPGFGNRFGSDLHVVWDHIFYYNEVKPEIAIPDLVARTEQKFLELLPSAELDVRDGFWQFAFELKEEKGLKLSLASNSKKSIVDAILKKIDITSTFDVILTGNEVSKPKPDPAIYKTVLKQLGLRPSELLAFEDSPAGVISSTKAGCTTVVVLDTDLVPSDYPKEASLVIASFDDLVGKLDYSLSDALKELAQEPEPQNS